MRLLLVSLVAAIAGSAHAAAADPFQCHVINDTAGTAQDEVPTGGSFTVATPRQKVLAHGATVDVACNRRHPAIALVDRHGRVEAVGLPRWFDVAVDGATVRVTAPAGAEVTIDGATAASSGGVASVTIDARARLEGEPLATVFDAAHGTWSTTVAVRASFHHEQADVIVRVDATEAGNALAAELAASSTAPVAWAAKPDPAGAAVVVGCWPSAPIAVRGLTRLADASMVAVCERIDASQGACGTHQRVQRGVIVRLIEAQTGRVVASTGFMGDAPPACDAAADHDTAGADVSPATIASWVAAQS